MDVWPKLKQLCSVFSPKRSERLKGRCWFCYPRYPQGSCSICFHPDMDPTNPSGKTVVPQTGSCFPFVLLLTTHPTQARAILRDSLCWKITKGQTKGSPQGGHESCCETPEANISHSPHRPLAAALSAEVVQLQRQRRPFAILFRSFGADHEKIQREWPRA